jgi:hypothetical protein
MAHILPSFRGPVMSGPLASQNPSISQVVLALGRHREDRWALKG